MPIANLMGFKQESRRDGIINLFRCRPSGALAHIALYLL